MRGQGDKSSSGVFAIVIEFGSRCEDLLFTSLAESHTRLITNSLLTMI